MAAIRRLGASRPVIELDAAQSPQVNLSFHRYNRGGLGVEVLVSDDLSSWSDFTRFYRVADPAPPSERGGDYDKVLMEPHSALPDRLYFQLNIRRQ